MFQTLKNRRTAKTEKALIASLLTDQKMLDQLRYDNRNDSNVQLHCDRMQRLMNDLRVPATRVVLAV